MEQTLGNDHMPGFFLDYLNFKLDGFTREKEAYDDFKTLFKANNYTNVKRRYIYDLQHQKPKI